MAEFVEVAWLKSKLDDPGVILIDPRSVVHYLRGHIKGAVNFPVTTIFDGRSFELLPILKLASAFADSGVSSDLLIVLYDEIDGQSAAMLAWTLEYLGHRGVKLVSTLYEKWVEDGNELYYRPVKPRSRVFHPSPNPEIRATINQIKSGDAKLVDLRSREEYLGHGNGGNKAAHIPGAINVPWTELLGNKHHLLKSKKGLEHVVSAAGLRPRDRVVTYCQTGPRAAVGYFAFKALGFRDVKLYDGSFSQWSQMTVARRH